MSETITYVLVGPRKTAQTPPDNGVTLTTMDDVADPVDDITAAADISYDADATASIPDASPTEIAELAWSYDVGGDEPLVPRRSLRSLLRWCLAIAAVLATAAAAAWFGTVFYHEQQSTPAMAPTVNRPTPGKSAQKPPQTTSPEPALQPPRKAPAAAPPPPTVTPPPPVTVTAPPPPVAAPSAPPLPDPPAHAYDTYVQLLARDGIAATDSPEVMHDEAYWICRARSTGDTAAVNGLIVKSEQKSPILSLAQIRAMLADTVEAYCPEYDKG
jgi:Protein of unknown function (DUF732)